MPRRRALTEAQLDALFALPATEADLIRHWTLDGTDLAAVDRRRGASNQLGYALQLCAFRYPGRLLRPGETIPEPALHFVAGQVHVGADALAAYAARRQTRQEQLDDLREQQRLRSDRPGPERPLHPLQHQPLVRGMLIDEDQPVAGLGDDISRRDLRPRDAHRMVVAGRDRFDPRGKRRVKSRRRGGEPRCGIGKARRGISEARRGGTEAGWGRREERPRRRGREGG